MGAARCPAPPPTLTPALFRQRERELPHRCERPQASDALLTLGWGLRERTMQRMGVAAA